MRSSASKAFLLSKLEKLNSKFSEYLGVVGIIALLLMMIITDIDVFTTKLFLSPLTGSIDAVMLSQLVMVSFATAWTLINDRHIAVAFLVPRLPRRVQAIINSIIPLLGLSLFTLIAYQSYIFGHSLQRMGEYTPTLRVPLYPFAYLIALASLPVCLAFLLKFLSALVMLIGKQGK